MLYQTLLIAVLCTIHVQGADDNQACEPLPPTVTSPRTGQKALDKCVEYQEKLVFPCEKNIATGGMTRSNRCGHNSEELIVGTYAAKVNEFPHIALLGYGKASWVCGAALISERFILTTAHCVSQRQVGHTLTHVLLGSMGVNNIPDENNIYKIKNIIKHPDYKDQLKFEYHDIALVEIENEIQLDQFRVPACLPVGESEENREAIETSYTYFKSNAHSSISQLRKTVLTKFSTEECRAQYSPRRLLKEGIDEATQICYGDRTNSTNSCERGSGGPLQVLNKKLNCMYDVIGVASLGPPCRLSELPDVYTKVSHYVPWIESIVWP